MSEAAQVIVCERTGRWAAAWQRALPDERIAWRQVRSVAECQEVLAESPSSAVLLEMVPAWTVRLGELVRRQQRWFGQAVVLLLADPAARPAAACLRSWGAAWTIHGLLEVSVGAAIVRRHLRQTAPRTEDPVARLKQSLPW